jgi:NADH:ubiquinone oxidoreductase subunit E
VLTFYTMFNLRPVGKNLLQFCTSISCHLLGAEALVEHCRKRLGIDLEETTQDGKFTMVEVECLAGCDKAPSMMVNDEYHEPMDAAKLDTLLAELGREAGAGRG